MEKKDNDFRKQRIKVPCILKSKIKYFSSINPQLNRCTKIYWHDPLIPLTQILEMILMNPIFVM